MRTLVETLINRLFPRIGIEAYSRGFNAGYLVMAQHVYDLLRKHEKELTKLRRNGTRKGTKSLNKKKTVPRKVPKGST